MAKPKIKSDGLTITVRVPISIRKRGGRKIVLAPDGTPGAPALSFRGADNAMVKAIARAFRWRQQLECGAHTTIVEIAAAEKINASYVGRILRLSLLAPDLVESILTGRRPPDFQLENIILERFPVLWQQQRAKFSRHSS